MITNKQHPLDLSGGKQSLLLPETRGGESLSDSILKQAVLACKRCVKASVLILSVLFYFTGITIGFAQTYFTAATTNQTSYSAGILTSRNTECDDMDYNGSHYRVTAFGSTGNSAGGIAWDVTSGGTGVVSFGLSGVINTDVSLINDGNGSMYAIAVYTDGHRILMEVFKWSSGAFVSFGSTSVVAYSLSIIFGTSLKMDASYNGDFAIVWDDPNGAIIGETGSLVGGVPTLSGNRVTINSANCGFPDVAMYNNSPEIAHISYIDYNSLGSNNGVLTVEDHSFSSLASGSATITSTFTTAATGNDYFASPRIASTDNSGNVNDWTVVYEDDLYNNFFLIVNYYIKGYNNASSGSYYTYNDGASTSPWNISGADNSFPVVTYDYNDNVWVGWNLDFVGLPLGILSNTYDAIYPIVLQSDNVAAPVANMPFAYWNVPDPLTTNDDYFALGLSGRHSTTNGELFMSYNDINNNDIDTKYITISGASSLKLAGSNKGVFDFKSNNLGKLQVFNEIGQQLFIGEGICKELLRNFFAKNYSKELSFLLLRFTDNESKSITTKKIIASY